MDLLIQGLLDEHSWVREEAAMQLGNIADEYSVQPLITALNDEVSSVRGKAAFALGRIGDTRASPHLKRIFSDSTEDSAVKEIVGRALGFLKEIEFLAQAFQDENVELRRYAMNGLYEAYDVRATAILVDGLEDEDADIRYVAARGLGDLKAQVALKKLREMQRTDHAITSWGETLSGCASEVITQIEGVLS